VCGCPDLTVNGARRNHPDGRLFSCSMVLYLNGEVWVRSTTPGLTLEGVLLYRGQGGLDRHVECFEIVVVQLDMGPSTTLKPKRKRF